MSDYRTEVREEAYVICGKYYDSETLWPKYNWALNMMCGGHLPALSWMY